MTDITRHSFVREDLVAERPAPVKTTGFIGLLRTRLFNFADQHPADELGACAWFTHHRPSGS